MTNGEGQSRSRTIRALRPRTIRPRGVVSFLAFQEPAARMAFCAFVCITFVALSAACRRDQELDAADQAVEQAKARLEESLIFPEELRVEDDSVNDFVERAMAGCASGDYERFRGLWGGREEPLPRAEYEQGWQAVQNISVRALEKVALAPRSRDADEEPRTAYALMADVALDPAHRAGRREPDRKVVLMLTRERGAWRLASPPDAMESWIRQFVESRDAASSEPLTPTTTRDATD